MAELNKSVGSFDIQIHEGTDFAILVTWRDEVNALIDLTGWTAKMQIRSQAHSCGKLLVELSDNNGLTLGGAAGTIQIVLDKTQNAFGSKTQYYDLDLISPTGQVNTILTGAIASTPEVTVNA